MTDEAELAVVLCEAQYQIQRPPGLTPSAALDAMDEECRAGWLRTARAAVSFFMGTIKQGTVQ